MLPRGKIKLRLARAGLCRTQAHDTPSFNSREFSLSLSCIRSLCRSEAMRTSRSPCLLLAARNAHATHIIKPLSFSPSYLTQQAGHHDKGWASLFLSYLPNRTSFFYIRRFPKAHVDALTSDAALLFSPSFATMRDTLKPQQQTSASLIDSHIPVLSLTHTL